MMVEDSDDEIKGLLIYHQWQFNLAVHNLKRNLRLERIFSSRLGAQERPN